MSFFLSGLTTQNIYRDVKWIKYKLICATSFILKKLLHSSVFSKMFTPC